MLNISENTVKGLISEQAYRSFSLLKNYRAHRVFKLIMGIAAFVFLCVLFLPWTQNIRANGKVTTLRPEQRPQTIHSMIDGRVEQWYVKEGDFTNKGDTILRITEIKEDYLDPNLLKNTESQIFAKEQTVSSYMEKIKALDKQIDALLKTKNLKIEQAENYLRQAQLKVESDSMDLVAARTNLSVAEEQFNRFKKLYDDGLKSLTELEGRKLKLQETQAKTISAENKLLASKNEVINAQVEIVSLENQYRDKLAKAESEKYTALSSMYDSEAMVTKMQNQYMNYSVRSGMYYITAPQDGFITKAITAGIGETVKAGEELVSIMPSDYDLAVEMYVEPVDLPLLNIGQTVRFIFDGWPSVAFSGWPNVSFGTYGGRVVAIDRFISANGKYRILVAPDPDDVAWPEAIRVGSGAKGMALLKDVPIWYEAWRQLNGFPPDFYVFKAETDTTEKKEEKKSK